MTHDEDTSFVQCGAKHLKWFGAIVGTVLMITSGLFIWTNVRMAEFELRMRMLEKSEAGNAARYEAIRDTLVEIKADMKDLSSRGPE